VRRPEQLSDGTRWRVPSTGVPRQFDLLDAIRVGSVPVGLGATGWTGSAWCFVGAILYNVVGGPVHDFLATVLGAAAERLADRIRHGPGRSPPSQAPGAPVG
jgi:hypothetical protein